MRWSAAACCLALELLGCTPARGTMGALIARDAGGRVVLREVPAELASARAGLAPGDELLLVEGRDARAMSDAELRRALQGEPGEVRRLTLLRGEQVLRVTLRLTPARRSMPTSARP
jgi:C-terminal processing protease CtpA/Prc